MPPLKGGFFMYGSPVLINQHREFLAMAKNRIEIQKAYDFFTVIWSTAGHKGWAQIRERLIDLQWFCYHAIPDEKESLNIQSDIVFLANIASQHEFVNG